MDCTTALGCRFPWFPLKLSLRSEWVDGITTLNPIKAPQNNNSRRHNASKALRPKQVGYEFFFPLALPPGRRATLLLWLELSRWDWLHGKQWQGNKKKKQSTRAEGHRRDELSWNLCINPQTDLFLRSDDYHRPSDSLYPINNGSTMDFFFLNAARMKQALNDLASA